MPQNIQQYRKLIDKRFRKSVPLQPTRKIVGDPNFFYHPNTQKGVPATAAEIGEMRNRYKQLARYNSRHVYGTFYDSATDTEVPFSELSRERVFAGDEQYQTFNRERNDRLIDIGRKW